MPSTPAGSDRRATPPRTGRATAVRSWLSRAWRGRPGDPAWVRPAVLALLAGTAGLYLWGLSASEWANSYYSAAAQAGAQSWKAWLFGSSDAANSITVDKTPGSLWLMSASVRLFGLSSWSVLAPQALQGVATVGVLYAAVRRVAGPGGGLLAGAVLAATPVAALMFRFNNPDALLTLLLVVAAYAVVRGLEGASTRWLVLAAVAIGFGFLTKMLQAFLIVPALAGVWLYAAPTSLRRRVGQLTAAGGALVVSAGWYVAMVALWPPGARPYIGGSQTNSIVELTLGYNGFQRLTGGEVGRIGGGGPAGGLFSDGAGALRLFEGHVGGQIAWLLPAALVLLAAGLWLRRGQPRTDALRASLWLWGGWLLVTGAVFSAMQGIFHGYYSVALAPAVGALVGLGITQLWARRHDRRLARLLLAALVLATALWSAVLLGRDPEWLPWLRPAVVTAGALGAAGLALAPPRMVTGPAGVRWPSWASAGAAVAALIGALAAPAAVSVATAATPHLGAIPSITPGLIGGSSFAFLSPDDGGVGLGDGFTGDGGVSDRGDARGGGPADPGGGDATAGDAPSAGGSDAGPGAGAGAPDGATTDAAAPVGGRPGDGFAGGARPLLPQPPGAHADSGRDGPRGALAGGGLFGRLPAAGGLGGLLSASQPPEELVETVQAGADQYTWAAAAIGSNQAAGVQLAAREPVMPVGGFNGTDPSPTLAQFRRYVASDRIHYFLSGASPGPGPAGFGPAQGGSNAASRIARWVRANFPSRTIGGVTVYDLDP